jgi:hypothetical protein
MSRNVPMEEDKPLPQILKASSAREIEIHNAADWDVPEDDPMEVEARAAAGAIGEPGDAAADGAKHDQVWEEMRRQDAVQQEKRKAEADRLVRVLFFRMVVCTCGKSKAMSGCLSQGYPHKVHIYLGSYPACSFTLEDSSLLIEFMRWAQATTYVNVGFKLTWPCRSQCASLCFVVNAASSYNRYQNLLQHTHDCQSMSMLRPFGVTR